MRLMMDKSIKKLLNFTETIYIDETTIFNIFKQNQEGGMGSISFGIVEFDDVDYVNCWAMKNVIYEQKIILYKDIISKII